ncbi:MAG: hypothetical protein J07HN6_01052 [Halonotius sp. J07HN6]|nr:MAG: hypothetical protein J07HN6_01052 [Halonotius sp. J07HN6]
MVGRIRPVVLTAALLVLGATAGIGAVSAAVDTGGSSMAVSQTTNEDLAVSQTTDEGRFVDANLTDGGVYWQGQRLMLGNLSATIANNTNLSNVESLHLRRYNADRRTGGGCPYDRHRARESDADDSRSRRYLRPVTGRPADGSIAVLGR